MSQKCIFNVFSVLVKVRSIPDRMKYLLVILPSLLMLQSSWGVEVNKSSPNMKIRYTSVNCTILDPDVITDLSCNIKAYSRDLSTANFGFTIAKNLMKFMMKVNLEYKYGTIYREGRIELYYLSFQTHKL